MKIKKDSLKIIFFMAITAMLFVSCAPETDIKPPETNIEKIQSVYGKTGVRVVLSGKDEKTPANKLTYEYQIYSKKNGKADDMLISRKIQDNQLSHTVEEIPEGSYIIRAWAINEFGIKDKTPAESSFRIDLTPPPAPEVVYTLKNGQVYLSCLEDDETDAVAYEMQLSDSNESKGFSSVEEDFVFSAEKGERYQLKIKAVDFAGNYSSEKTFVINADVDDAPVFASDVPLVLGKNDKKFIFEVYDDWDAEDKITKRATFSGVGLKFESEYLTFDLSTVQEGTHTLSVYLEDANEHQIEIKKEIFVDLTPPHTPEIQELKEDGKKYVLSWKDVSDEESTYKIYGFNKLDTMVLLDETFLHSYKTDKRFLHYVVTAIDKAGNESSTSYPLRTYNEKYVPVTSSNIGVMEENTLLTSLYSPYRINTTVEVPEGLMLGVEKGVEIIFEDGGSLSVEGQILSMPSNSDKKRKVTTEFSEDQNREDNIVTIKGGSVWLNDFELNGDDETDLFVIEIGGELRAQGIDVKGFRTFINSVDADQIFVDDARIHTSIFATGTDCMDMKLKKATVESTSGIKIMNVKNLEIDHCTVISKAFAVQLDGFSNAFFNHSDFVADRAIIMNKLSAADANAVQVKGIESALSVKGASTINLRNSTLSASNTAVFVDRSAYLCAIESTVTNSRVGLYTLNTDIVLKDVKIVDNITGISTELEKLKKAESITFNNNQSDSKSARDR